MRDQDKVTFSNFNGLFSRGDDDNCPLDHFIDCDNLQVGKVGVQTREGSIVDLTRAARIRRMKIYKPLTSTPHIIVLQENGANFDLYDLSFSTVTPVLAGITRSDFSMTSVYGRAYISFHDRTIASCTGNLYVYDGSGPTGIRLAGGVPPTAALVDTGTGAGNIEAGDLLLLYCYETASGFITAPYVAGLIKHTFAAANNSISITVPNGPAGTVAKRIIAAKTIPTGFYNGDYRTQEYFFVPGNGRIGDNVTTALTLSFFNSELIDSADYLFSNLSTIPSGLLVTTYGTRLVVGGDANNVSSIYFSSPGTPEAISAVSGFVVVDPSEQGGITNGFESQGSFIITKRKRTYVTSDNSDTPSTWPIDTIDASIGAECHGISVITESAGSWQNITLVADRAGIMVFNGVYQPVPLTDKVKAWWETLDKAVFDQIQVLVDTQLKRIYILVPKGADNTLPYPNMILVGTFFNGITPKDIQWTPWSFYPTLFATKDSINCIMMDYTSSSRPILKLGMNTDLVKMDKDTFSDLSSRYSIPAYFRFPAILLDDDDSVCTFIQSRIRGKGQGRFYISGSQINDTIIFDYRNFVDLQTAPGSLYDKLMNYQGQRCSFTFHMNTQATQPFNTDYFAFNKITFYGKVTWSSLPSLTHVRT